MSDEVVYTSKARIERVKGPLRRAYLPEVGFARFVRCAFRGCRTLRC